MSNTSSGGFAVEVMRRLGRCVRRLMGPRTRDRPVQVEARTLFVATCLAMLVPPVASAQLDPFEAAMKGIEQQLDADEAQLRFLKARLIPEEELSPLILAVQRGNSVEVARLLEDGANADEVFRKAFSDKVEHTITPLSVGVWGSSMAVSPDYYLEKRRLGADVTFAPASQDILDALLNRGANPNPDLETPIIVMSSLRGDVAATQRLLAAGADVNGAMPESLRTALMCASEMGHTDVVGVLTQTGADAAAKDSKGRTALMCASEMGHAEVVEVLTQAGADGTAKDSMGRTALMYASEMGHTDAVEILIQAGADAAAKDSLGRTALDIVKARLRDSSIKKNKESKSTYRAIAKLLKRKS